MSTIKIANAASAGPLCINCVNAVKRIKDGMLCGAPQIVKEISLVSGAQVGPKCSSARSDNGECTPAGRLFVDEANPAAYEDSAAATACPASSIDDPRARTVSSMSKFAMSSSAGATRDATTPAK